MLCAGQLVSGWLIARTSPRFVMGLSASLAALGFVSTAAANGLVWVCVSYGVVCGLSVGLGANCVLATVLPWFPGCRGTVSGLLLAGDELACAQALVELELQKPKGEQLSALLGEAENQASRRLAQDPRRGARVLRALKACRENAVYRPSAGHTLGWLLAELFQS